MVTGDAPITLDWNSTPGKKSTKYRNTWYTFLNQIVHLRRDNTSEISVRMIFILRAYEIRYIRYTSCHRKPRGTTAYQAGKKKSRPLSIDDAKRGTVVSLVGFGYETYRGRLCGVTTISRGSANENNVKSYPCRGHRMALEDYCDNEAVLYNLGDNTWYPHREKREIRRAHGIHCCSDVHTPHLLFRSVP